ncbi:Bifunctional cytokinin biosynthesis protein [Lachnellula suecica]|uniref:Bifunctional cytokinin biosynthesis protein n=1 Tax=Lachnellula suecica TaxID=602035 RepID=A0A8T9BRY0_9HELO|nr:Bifunctional cytokinin biosynthesis protein [Lachnellula suecica]
MASGGASPAPSILNGSSTPNPSPLNPDINAPLTSTSDAPPHDPSIIKNLHMEAARSLARTMAAHNIHLVYGGGTVGLMGEVARTLVSLTGPTSVHGIIPSPLVKYERGPDSDTATSSLPAYETYGRTTVVKDMHTRKALMAKEVLSGAPGSGFVALSGGYGTLEELMEVVTWNQLGDS